MNRDDSMTEKLLTRLGQIEELGKKPFSSAISLRTAGLSFIEKIYGKDHPNYEGFSAGLEPKDTFGKSVGLEILQSIREEIEGGWLISFKDLIAGELFSDFLEMATHLLDEQYKDAAAVITGSVLEGHMRKLCASRSIPIEVKNRQGQQVPKKANSLNSDLAKGGAYSQLDSKNVTAWLDLRNKAAHGQYNEYTHQQVSTMLLGVREFVARVN